MATRHREPDDETLRLAVELHARDQEAQQTSQAQAAALGEMDIPPEYLKRARREQRRKERAAEERRAAIGVLSSMALLIAALGTYLALRPPSKPIAETFAASATQRWTLDTNEGTQARVSFAAGTARIEVDRFAPSPGPRFPGRHWATLRTIDGDKNLRTLQSLSFRARGEGLSRVRFRFVRGSRSYVTPSFLVNPGWQEFRVPLDNLRRFKDEERTSERDGTFTRRVASKVEEVQVQTGSFINSVDSRGILEIDDIRLE